MVAHPPTYTYSAHCTNTFVTVCSQETCDDGHRWFHELHTVRYIFQVSKRLNFTKISSWVKIFRKLFCLTSSFACVTSVKSILSLKQLQISGALPLHWAWEVENVFLLNFVNFMFWRNIQKQLKIIVGPHVWLPVELCHCGCCWAIAAFFRNLIGQHAAHSLRSIYITNSWFDVCLTACMCGCAWTGLSKHADSVQRFYFILLVYFITRDWKKCVFQTTHVHMDMTLVSCEMRSTNGMRNWTR